ncbi:T9SS type A sorting domain-containing protein [Flammeovirga pectinis]|uniref:T9SS type A sorting domain-containing protein n=1 Tax=Flammeovirga pectinis TaxID=2494373 RepID=A0A3S9NZ83_9BACT|nr:CotH kinase family protein [Flammeovirga pectinis]AZQ61166.1 T9SS type A sorting domain-containing protein [Flammeovirga pectinis]
MKRILLTIFLFISYFITLAQNLNPENGILFPEDEINRVDITMNQSDLDFLLAPGNEENREYKECVFEFENSMLSDSLHNVGIRLRGNTSRYAPKKSFKISFNKFEKGRTFHEQKKFNLRAEHNDPTLSREKSLLMFFRDEDIPAARSSHVRLYINGDYYGLYLNTEQIDDLFLANRFDDDSGKLYKASFGADMVNDPNLYMNDDIYELEEGDEDDRDELASFLDSLNILNDNALSEYLDRNFDVDKFIKTLAIEQLSGHWDNNSYNKNNFYVYWNETTNLWTYIPYDLDNTYGIDWVDKDWGNRDINNWPKEDEARPLSKKILANATYSNQYNSYLSNFIDSTFNSADLDPYFEVQHDLLRAAVAADTWYTKNYGWTVTDYDESFITSIGGHVDYGIQEYINTRVRSAKEQIIITDFGDEYLNSEIKIYPNPASHHMIIELSEVPYKRCLISLTNLNGQTIKRWNKKAGNVLDLRIDNVHQGTYVLSIELENQQKSWIKIPSKKVVIL